MYDKVTKAATGRNIVGLFALFFVFNTIILPAAQARIEAFSGGVGPIDLKFGYTPAEVYSMISAYGNQGRSLYLLIELTVDMFYPLVYVLAFTLLIIYLAGRVFGPSNPWQNLYWLPVGVILADYGENMAIVAMLLAFPKELVTVATVANGFTMLKWGLFAATLLTTVVYLIIWVGQKIRAKDFMIFDWGS